MRFYIRQTVFSWKDRFTVTDEVLAEMGSASEELLGRTLERPLKSREFIDLFI